MKNLDETAIEEMSRYFGALAAPTRLKILNALMDGEWSVGALTRLTGCTQANVSKHLAVLAQNGIVARHSSGTTAFYRISDPRISKLCAQVCNNIGRRCEQQADRGRSFIAAAGSVAKARPVR